MMLILLLDFYFARVFGSHCLANFQPILDCFIPKFKLEYDDLENIKIDCVNTVLFSLHQIKHLKDFSETPGIFKIVRTHF